VVWTLRFPFRSKSNSKLLLGRQFSGVKNRLVLSDAAWERMAPLIIGRPDQKGSTGRDTEPWRISYASALGCARRT
jgi:hypothetical protein